MLLLKTEVHLYSSYIPVRPISDWANNQSNGVAPGVANQITGVAPATPGHSLDMAGSDLKRRNKHWL